MKTETAKGPIFCAKFVFYSGFQNKANRRNKKPVFKQNVHGSYSFYRNKKPQTAPPFPLKLIQKVQKFNKKAAGVNWLILFVPKNVYICATSLPQKVSKASPVFPMWIFGHLFVDFLQQLKFTVGLILPQI